MISKIDDYNAVLTELTTAQFLDADRFRAVIDSMAVQADEIEAALYALLDETWIENARGVWLDEIGEIVGLSRAGRDDASYRTLIRLRVSVNTGAGQIPLLIRVIEQIYNAGIVRYTPQYPAAFRVEHDGDLGVFIVGQITIDDSSGPVALIDDTGDELYWGEPDDDAADVISDVIPAGVRLENYAWGAIHFDDGSTMVTQDNDPIFWGEKIGEI